MVFESTLEWIPYSDLNPRIYYPTPPLLRASSLLHREAMAIWVAHVEEAESVAGEVHTGLKLCAANTARIRATPPNVANTMHTTGPRTLVDEMNKAVEEASAQMEELVVLKLCAEELSRAGASKQIATVLTDESIGLALERRTSKPVVKPRRGKDSAPISGIDRFSSLPPESRFSIYDILFTSILHPDASPEDPQACQPLPPILHTSGLLRREALLLWSGKLDEALNSNLAMEIPLHKFHLAAFYVVCDKERAQQVVTPEDREASERATCRLQSLEDHREVLRALVRILKPRSSGGELDDEDSSN
ncbi:hypothetical protein LTR95_008371 [Oleoguttula sp. CCFEE 5521]